MCVTNLYTVHRIGTLRNYMSFQFQPNLAVSFSNHTASSLTNFQFQEVSKLNGCCVIGNIQTLAYTFCIAEKDVHPLPTTYPMNQELRVSFGFWFYSVDLCSTTSLHVWFVETTGTFVLDCQFYWRLFPSRYLIDTRWFKQWKKFVGFDNWDSYNVGEESANPGPIDNAQLFSGI